MISMLAGLPGNHDRTHIPHERWGSTSDPSLNGHLLSPNDLDGPLNETVSDKIHQYRADYNNRPSNTISVMTTRQPVQCLHIADPDS